MKTKVTSLIKLTVTILLLASANTYAQRVSDVQNTNLRAPGRVKIDGKLTEWEYPLKAFNSNTKLYYSMANDDQNLYLVIRSSEAQNITKIFAGGITLKINANDKKKDKNQFSITFPVISRAARRNMRQGGGGGFGRGGGGGVPVAPDSASIAATHKAQIAACKELSVLGFKDITDTTISIYNEYGIQTAVNYDSNNALVMEFAVPLKLLGIATDKPKEFMYNLIVNGQQQQNNRGGGDGGGGFGGGGFGGGNGGGGFGGGGGGFGGGGGGRGGGGGGGRGGNGGGGGGNIDVADLVTPTDFWGKYILAKGIATTATK